MIRLCGSDQWWATFDPEGRYPPSTGDSILIPLCDSLWKAVDILSKSNPYLHKCTVSTVASKDPHSSIFHSRMSYSIVVRGSTFSNMRSAYVVHRILHSRSFLSPFLQGSYHDIYICYNFGILKMIHVYWYEVAKVTHQHHCAVSLRIPSLQHCCHFFFSLFLVFIMQNKPNVW